jgi:hypothetical protein
VSEEQPRPEEQKKTKSGIEVALAKKYPELYAKLKDLSERTGKSILDLMASYTNWAIELREYATFVTEADLKNITPEALYSALKLLMFFEERYIRLISYINVAQAEAVINTMFRLFYPMYTSQQSTAPATPFTPPPPPQPDRVSRLMDAILRAIEMFSMGQEDVRRQLAREIAEELLRLSQPSQSSSTSSSK